MDLVKKAKASIRRAQVRKAQIEHRQRKANHVKELELNVSNLREMVAQTEKDIAAFQMENEAIRTLLSSAQPGLGSSSLSPSQLQTSPGQNNPAQTDEFLSAQMQAQNLTGAGAAGSPEMFGGINVQDFDVQDLTVTLSLDSALDSPVFSVSSSSAVSEKDSPKPAPETQGEFQLNVMQQEMVINFILALEHCCWNHFSRSTFRDPGHDPVAAAQEDESGHVMLASAYCMSSAPESVYDEWAIFNRPTGCGKPAGASSSSAAAARPSTITRTDPPQLNWQTPSISLERLHAISQELNPNDVELTPVQAWFELVRRYGYARLLEPGVLESLRSELHNLVHCVFYGAGMERLAFENAVARILGPAPGTPLS